MAEPTIENTLTAGERPVRSGEPWAARRYFARNVLNKAGRKAKRLLGRGDPNPWIIRPKRSGRGTAYVDFMFGLDYLSPNSDLVSLFTEAMAPLGLSFLLVNKTNLQRVIEEIASGWLRPHLYLDLCSAVEPAFWELLETAARAGVHTIADPRTQPIWTIKATSHPRLAAAGLPLPPTVIINRDEADRDLTAEERALVGERCVIKPSFGVAGRGTVVGVEPTRQAIATAREFNRADDWLIQKMITWGRYGARQAYLRSYNVLGHRTMLWWCKEQGIDTYEMLSWEDVRRYDLLPAAALTDRIAALSGMEYFSSEIAILGGPEVPAAERFVLIDYINDQCDMDPQSGPGRKPIPRQWVRWVCGRFATEVFRRKRGVPAEGAGTLTLPER